MQYSEIWKYIQEALKKKDFFSQFYPENEKSHAFLLIDFGPDYKAQDRFVKLSITEQEMGQGAHVKSINADNPVYSFEYAFELPVTYYPNNAKETASLINFINRQISHVQFELDEMRDAIFLRCSYFTTLNGIDDRIITACVGLMLMYLDIYVPVIEEVSSGKKKFNEIIEQMIKINLEYLNPRL